MKWDFMGGAVLLLVASNMPGAAQTAFPYDQEMVLEAKPMPGSRRIPIIEIHADGKATVDLWCHSATADVAIAGDTIKFTFLTAQPQGCTPERAALDQAMGAAMAEVTTWKRENDVIVLTGPTTFRFRLSTH